MQLLETRRSSRGRKWRQRSLWLAVAGIAALGWLAKEPAIERYRYWKQQRALKQAKQFIDQHDAANAQIALEVALVAVPGSTEAWRVAADMLEQVGAPQAMKLRRRVVQMAPDSADDRAALVMCAVRFRDFNAARDGLIGMTPQQAAQPKALEAALAFALSTDNAPVADALFDRMKPLYPLSDDLKLAQALLRLRHPKPEKSTEARRELEVLMTNPKYALRIHRELRSDAMGRREYEAAKRWAAAAVADPKSDLGDRLNAANLDLLIDKRPFAEVFAKVSPAVPADAAGTVQFTRWLLVQGQAAAADRWMGGLPAELQKTFEVGSVRAEVASALQDWDRLATMLEAGAWGPLPKDTIRLAMSARLVAARSKATLQREIWDEAVQSAGKNLATLRVLLQLAGMWQWADEEERTLWAITRVFPDQTWAHQTLFNIFRGRKNTEAMRNLMATLREIESGVLRYQHDWALLSLLTTPTAAWDTPKDTLKGLYTEDPTNSSYATGYAFALAQARRPAEAMAVVEKLPAAEREYPVRAPYLAYIFAMGRNKAEFDKYAAMGPSLDLLPEERQLFTLGREAMERPLIKPSSAPVKPALTAPKAAPKT